MKPSKVGWKTLPIGEIFEFSQYGLSIPTAESGNIPILGMKDIQDGKVSLINISAKVSLSEDDLKKYALQDGDILLNRTNSLDLVGKVGIFEGGETVVFASYLVRFRVDKSKANPKYVDYFLNSTDSKLKLRALATPSISQANINPTIFQKKFEILLPPLPEQDRIAVILSTWDEAIAKTEALIERKEKQKNAIRAKLFQSANEYIKLGQLAEVRRGASPRPIDNPLYFSEAGPGWVRIADATASKMLLRKTTQHLSELGVSKSVLVQPGDLIMSICATIGVPRIMDMQACIHDGFVLIRPRDRNSIDPFFLYHLLEYLTPKLAGSGQPGTQKNLNTSIVGAIQIPAFGVDQQRKIAEILAISDDEISLLEDYRVRLIHQKQGLMQKLLTGEWPVSVKSLEEVVA